MKCRLPWLPVSHSERSEIISRLESTGLHAIRWHSHVCTVRLLMPSERHLRKFIFRFRVSRVECIGFTRTPTFICPWTAFMNSIYLYFFDTARRFPNNCEQHWKTVGKTWKTTGITIDWFSTLSVFFFFYFIF